MPLLRDLIMVPMLPPLYNNIAAAMLMVFYYRFVIEFVTRFRERLFQALKFQSRQILQMALSTSIVFWPLFDTSEWSWKLNALLPAAMMIRMIFKAKVVNDPDDIDVMNFSRASAPDDLVYGPLQLCALMIWLGLYQFMTQEAAILAAAVGIGDSMAPFIGAQYGRHVYNLPISNPKTMEGSLVGVFFGSVLASYVYLYMMGLEMPPLRYSLVYGALAAGAEGSAPGNFDNIFTPLLLYFSIDKVKEIL